MYLGDWKSSMVKLLSYDMGTGLMQKYDIYCASSTAIFFFIMEQGWVFWHMTLWSLCLLTDLGPTHSQPPEKHSPQHTNFLRALP